MKATTNTPLVAWNDHIRIQVPAGTTVTVTASLGKSAEFRVTDLTDYGILWVEQPLCGYAALDQLTPIN